MVPLIDVLHSIALGGGKPTPAMDGGGRPAVPSRGALRAAGGGQGWGKQGPRVLGVPPERHGRIGTVFDVEGCLRLGDSPQRSTIE